MLQPDVELYELSDSFFSVFPEANRKSDYDFNAKFYDFIVPNPLPQKLIWKNSLEDYHNFCVKALNSAESGAVLDAGCGSLVFTARAYSECHNRPILLLDRSLVMLQKAAKRLTEINGRIPENILLLQADIFDLPFREKTFATVNSFGMLHLFDDTKTFLDSLNHVLNENGRMYLLVLLGETPLGKFVTNIFKRTGEIALALNSERMRQRIMDAGFNLKLNVKGNIGYIELFET